MIYQITNEFTKLNESSGIIQNTSNVYPVEIATTTEQDSGILIFPLNTLYFSGNAYLRCTDENAQAYIRVVSFGTGSDSSSGSSGGVKTEPTLTVDSSGNVSYDGDGQLFLNMDNYAFGRIKDNTIEAKNDTGWLDSFSGTIFASEGSNYAAKSVTFSKG